MKKNFNNYCLIVVLAFLQCLVPLLHAHAGGVPVTSHVHIHVDVPATVHHALTHELRADSCDFPVVGAASEFKRDQAGDGLALALTNFPWLIQPPCSEICSAQLALSILPEDSLFSGSPPSHAPPAGS